MQGRRLRQGASGGFLTPKSGSHALVVDAQLPSELRAWWWMSWMPASRVRTSRHFSPRCPMRASASSLRLPCGMAGTFQAHRQSGSEVNGHHGTPASRALVTSAGFLSGPFWPVKAPARSGDCHNCGAALRHWPSQSVTSARLYRMRPRLCRCPEGRSAGRQPTFKNLILWSPSRRRR